MGFPKEDPVPGPNASRPVGALAARRTWTCNGQGKKFWDTDHVTLNFTAHRLTWLDTATTGWQILWRSMQ
ncbi:uncharacterized protein N7482_003871 [Penicillium canariense]|uniref:Uncharacterized protein n=1 Tax=Penicillium canariense TaxID=189055 RepID=A0A9W9I9D3_9EURO|nr:uncharacterized protein N7482_003871 [Penicillium canariense]KAJ5168277.1 hypothetical protein N7482_003871 [Penicillium canariense]